MLVDLAIERGPTGPYVRMNSCQAQIGYADAYIENGGLIGDIVNSQFRASRLLSELRGELILVVMFHFGEDQPSF